MKWIRSIRRTGNTNSVNLPNDLTRALGIWRGGIIQIEWSEGEKTITLRPVPNLSLLPPPKPEEMGKTYYWRETNPRRNPEDMGRSCWRPKNH